MEKNTSILIVDDDLNTLKTVSMLLEKKGYDTDTAPTGAEAVAKCKQQFFNIALLDIRLPDIAGIDLLTRIKEIRPGIEIIMVTGYASVESAVQTLKSGASAYISKPINLDEVLSTIAQITEKQRLRFEKQQAEDALRENEAFLRQIIDANPNCIYVKDLFGRYVLVNTAIADLYDISPEEMIGRSDTELAQLHSLTPEEAEFFEAYDRAAIRENQAKLIPRKTFTRRDGSQRWFRGMKVPLVYHGRPDHMLGISVDITDLVNAEEDLRVTSQQLQTLFDSLDEMYFSLDVKDHKLLQISPACEKIFELPQRAFFENPEVWQSFVHPDDAHQMTDIPSELMAGHVVEREVRITPPDGKTRWIALKIKPAMDEQGEIIRHDGIIADITERKRMETELLKVQKLESIGILAGGIAHDFNNLITAILGNISLAASEARATNQWEMLELLEESQKASLRARDLTKQLLTFSKGGAPVKQIISIGTLLEETTTFALRGSHVRCQFAINPALWPVNADEGQLSQVVHNLVINAQQAMPNGGTITLKAENLVVPANTSTLPGGNYVKITIADNGIGIPPEHLSKVFDPYFTTKQKGSGLGLATVYSIIKRHDGQISLDSSLGQGSTFDIFLPASSSDAPQTQRINTEITAGQGRILIMDDEESVRALAARILTRAGYEVEVAEDGAEAIEKYRIALESGQPFAAVILDLTVPGGMGGEQALTQLSKIDPYIKAIVSSGYSTGNAMTEYKKQGFCDIAPKPYDMAQLSEVVSRVVHNQT